MARTLNGDIDVKRGDVLRLWPEDIIVDPAKRGRTFLPTQEDVEAMGMDIGTNGQEQPVPVNIRPHDKRVELYAGFTRHEAITWWNATFPEQRMRIECVARDRNPQEAFVSNIKENLIRNPTGPMNDAFNIRALTEKFHLSDEEIRKLYAGGKKEAMSPSWLNDMRALVTLETEYQEQIHNGTIPLSIGIQLAKMDPAKRAQTLQDATADGGKATTTKVLAAARKNGALTGPKALKMPEIRQGFEYLAKEGRNEKVKRLAGAFLEYQANKLPEPDFFQAIYRILP